MKSRTNNNKRNKESDKQNIPLDDIVEEFQIEEIASQDEIYLDVFLSKNQCTSYSFSKTPINKKAYLFLVYDKSGKNYMCQFYHKFCHEKCRGTLVQEKIIAKKERLNYLEFICHCGVVIKHTFDLNSKKNKKNSNMMQINQESEIIPYHCISHVVIV